MTSADLVMTEKYNSLYQRRMMLALLTWYLLGVSWTSAQERESGVLYDHTALGLRPWASHIMKNNDYPNPAPHTLVQTWRFVAMEEPSQRVAIKTICNKIYIPKDSGSDKCTVYNLTFTDSHEEKELCGDIGQLLLMSQTNDVLFELRTGPQTSAIVDCDVQAVPVTINRHEISTTTTTTAKPTLPGYLTMASEEIDSSEHGGEEGDKRTSCPCGWANKATSRIVNGMETARNEFPFTAGLVYRGTRDRFCGATIITRFHALTAAHCTHNEKAEGLSVVVGIHNMQKDWSFPADEVPVERIIPHEEFDYDNRTDDISLLVLAKGIQYGQFVGPACLPPAQPALNIDRQYVTIIGWGAEAYMGQGGPLLKKVNLRVVPAEECRRIYRQISVDNPRHICTYGNKKSSCQGDSGGPVVWVDPETNRYTLVGVVSFSIGCANGYPGVQTKVQAYLPWIHRHISRSNKQNSQTCNKLD